MSGHARLAPSAASRWMNCPGSIALSEGIPDSSSAAAREGTFAHEIAEKALVSGRTAAHFIGVKSGKGETDIVDEFTCDAEMAEHVQHYVDAVLSIPTENPDDLHVEDKVALVGLRDDITGTVDAWVREGETLHVFDLKYGAGVFVDVRHNPQLMIYALGVLLSNESLRLYVNTVVLHVVQPRHHTATAKDEGGHSSCVLDGVELRQWGRDDLYDAANATVDDALRLATGSWCKFCPAKPQCPALRQLTHDVAAHAFSDVSTPAKAPPDPSTLDDAELARVLRAAPLVADWLAAVHVTATKRARNGHAIPGNKLARAKTNRAWKDPAAAVQALDLMGVDPYADRKPVSPAQAEKRLGKAARAMVASLVHKPEGQLVLVPDSDPRAAVDVAAPFLDALAQ